MVVLLSMSSQQRGTSQWHCQLYFQQVCYKIIIHVHYIFINILGAADYNGIRSHRIRTADYFTYLMKYDDGRFSMHPRFHFFALKTEMHWRAKCVDS